jgi:hypothetical protein
MARVMIKDLLALTAGVKLTTMYMTYYAVHHPDMVKVQRGHCKICTDLLVDLFNSISWHSAVVDEGDQIRVNYYLCEL